MKKIGVIFDSSSNLTYKKAVEKGAGFIPLVINFNNQIKKSNIDINQTFLFENMKRGDTTISTASPIQKDIIDEFRRMLKIYDEVIFIGISKKFSGTINSARVVVEQNPEFQEKIHIYNSLFSAPWLEFYVDEIIEIVKSTDDLLNIYDKLDYLRDKMIGWLAPRDIYWFYQGGRITKNQYLIGNIAKIIPILTIVNGEIDQKLVMKAFSLKNAINKIIKRAKLKKEEFDKKNIKYNFAVLYAGDKELTKLTKNALVKELGVEKEKILTSELSPEQVAHMGPGAFGIAFIPKFNK